MNNFCHGMEFPEKHMEKKMGPKYCDQKKNDEPDGYCSNSVFKEYAQCATCLISNQENLIRTYSRARVLTKEKLMIAEEALLKLANDTSPPWDNLDWKKIAREALENIKR